MGKTADVAINEGVALLDALSPARLGEMKSQYPLIARQLELGIKAGATEDEAGAPEVDPYLTEKAQVMIAALGAAWKAAEDALTALSARVKTARRQRLVSQALVLIGSSSSLATLALSKNTAAVISAALTLLAALGNLAAEYQEKLLSPQAGSIYENFQKLAEGAYKARSLATELNLALKYDHGGAGLKNLISNANALCEELNSGLVQLLATVPQKQLVPSPVL